MDAVASAAGVARSTVSKALRNDPTIPHKRCLAIQKIATRLGYRPNPMVATLMAQLHSQRRRTDPYHIAWLDLWSERDPPPVPIIEPLLQGARRRAVELGYDIEVYHPARDGIGPSRLRQILTTKSQWGLIIPPVPESAMRYPLDLRGLAGVTVGTSLHEPVMHRVSPNHFQGAQLACERLRSAGFNRIGLALSRAMNERVERKWLGGFLAEQYRWPSAQSLPALLVDPEEEARFEAWRREQRPDVLLIAEPHVAAWAKRNGKRLPVAWLALLEQGSKRAQGIDYQPELLGGAAVELVIAQIHRNERGSPANPHTVYLESVWGA